MNINQELQRCSRTIRGTELRLAEARAHRLTMAEMGISSTNLVFDSDLAESFLDRDVLDILKDDPDMDSGIMHTRVPVNSKTSSIAESDQGGVKPLDLNADDDQQGSFMSRHDLNILDQMFSGSERVIQQLQFFIHDLERWRKGFDPVKFMRSEHKFKQAARLACIPDANLTKRGKVTTRRRRRPSRVTAKHRAMSGLMA